METGRRRGGVEELWNMTLRNVSFGEKGGGRIQTMLSASRRQMSNFTPSSHLLHQASPFLNLIPLWIKLVD